MQGPLRRILIIAPGEVSLPNIGWGAVEYIVMKHAKLLNSYGFEVIVLNSWHHRDWLKALRMRPTFVILHYDIFSVRWHFYRKFFRVPTLVISHFGFAAFPNLWNKTFRRSVRYFTKFEYIGCLSPQIQKEFVYRYPISNFVLTPNGTEIEDYVEVGSNLYNKFIVLGKVEERKKQIAMSVKLKNHPLIDFVGPIQDPAFLDLPEQAKKQYLGEWSRDKINRELPKYRGLILMSDAEADALVLHEALSAGIEIFVSRNAIGSQSASEWIHLVDNLDDLEEMLTNCLKGNRISPDLIRRDAAKRSWKIRVDEISKLIINSP
jgi:hypothetical protein